MQLELTDREAGIIANIVSMVANEEDPYEWSICARAGACPAPKHPCRLCEYRTTREEEDKAMDKFISIVIDAEVK